MTSESTTPQGTKHDEGKVCIDLMPPEAIERTAVVFTFGAKKYGDYNWRKGIHFSRVFAATMRHLWAWWRGEETDKESGLSHLDHAACCINMLQAYDSNFGYLPLDDRFFKKVKFPNT